MRIIVLIKAYSVEASKYISSVRYIGDLTGSFIQTEEGAGSTQEEADIELIKKMYERGYINGEEVKDENI